MKNLLYISLFLLFVLSGCDENFHTWKELNEQWLVEQRGRLGQPADGEDEIIETMVLPSGVLVEVFHNGYGPVPKPSVDPINNTSSYVKVTYKGWLIDGTKFNDAENISMYLSNTIPGWQDALGRMRQGSHWRIYIPHDQGYGEEGSKGAYDNFSVPPYSTLIFDIDLVDVMNF